MKEYIGDFSTKKNICKFSGKIMYSRRDAGNVINGFGALHNCGKRKSLSHLYRGDNKPNRMYFCEKCGAYHVTHYTTVKNPHSQSSHKIKDLYNNGYSDYIDDDLDI